MVQRVLIPRIDYTPSDMTLLFSFKRGQIPLCIEFCMMINKVQGPTLDYVGIYFTHGQMYIAMSRGRSFYLDK